MANDAVTLAYIHNGKEVAYSWHKSIVDMIGYDLTKGGHIIRGGWAACRFSHNIVDARNIAIRDWLDDPERAEVDWFFWLDTDMGFQPDILYRLLVAADPEKRPIVGGLCFTWSEEVADGFGGYRCEPRPTMFKWAAELGTVCVADYPVNSLVDVAATGSACILIHRSVLEAMREEHGDHWYDRIENPYIGGMFSEDISFCLRAGALGFPTYVNTGARTSHLKHLWVSEADHWLFRPAPPATERTTVIVPVLNRPQNAAPFMDSLRASTGMADVVAVCSEDEDAQAWRDAGARVVETDKVTFAEKVNVATTATEFPETELLAFGESDRTVVKPTPFIFIVGDDVRFHPGWLDHAQHVANLQGAHVVGTNDLGNPRVMAGEHGTHLLIRRSYIEEQGASWDGPGVVCHEGYRHWYVDDEIVTVAKQRGVWAAALGSIVEHLHPAWGKADDDDTYKLGHLQAQTDMRHFKSRLAKYGPKQP